MPNVTFFYPFSNAVNNAEVKIKDRKLSLNNVTLSVEKSNFSPHAAIYPI